MQSALRLIITDAGTQEIMSHARFSQNMIYPDARLAAIYISMAPLRITPAPLLLLSSSSSSLDSRNPVAGLSPDSLLVLVRDCASISI